MTAQNPTQPNQAVSLIKPMLLGAVAGLILISFFVFGVKPDPAWPELWYIKPLIVTPAAGAAGGAFYYLMDSLSFRGLNKTAAFVLSILVFIAVLWLGTVLGLSGTLWD